MLSGIQSFYLSAGNESCFFLSLIDIAEKRSNRRFDVETVAWICSKKGYVFIDWEDLSNKKNFLVIEHAKILSLLTGEECVYEKESPAYKKSSNEYVINEYQNGKMIHFDGEDFHSLQKSETIKNGKIISKRVFRFI